MLGSVLNLVIFTVPDVLWGGQLGSRVASRISQRVLERGLGVLFALVSFITLADVILRS